MRGPLVVVVVGLLLLMGAPASPGAVNQLTFVESSAALGVAESSEIWGTAVADWDGDGCDDLYVGRHAHVFPRLYRNGCPGPFTDEVARLKLDQLPNRLTRDRHTPAFADYDGDGRMDLFVATGAKDGYGDDEDQLFRQLPDGTFENVAPALGITDTLGSGRYGIWFDYDGDGDLDLFVAHRVHQNRKEENRNILWRSAGGTAFANVAAAAGIGDIESSVSGIVADLDGDGRQEVMVVPGTRGSLYLNQGGTFVKQDLGSSNIQSVAAGDYDNDGDLDLFLARGRPGKPAGPQSVFLRNDGGTWIDVTAAVGVGVSLALSAAWLDVNNDGYLDLFVTRDVDDVGQNVPNALFINNGNGTFTDVAGSAGVTGPTDGDSDSAAWGDFNGDGALDIVVGVNLSATSVLVYLNQEAANHWFIVQLRDPQTLNRQAIGAKVWLTTGGRTQYREVIGGGAFRSQTPSYLHFGLGSATSVDTLRIRWPDGTEEIYSGVAVDQRYTATKGGGMALARRARR